jgi:hypothetical protein
VGIGFWTEWGKELEEKGREKFREYDKYDV